MINYILQVILFQILFLAVYDFFLKKETFFKWNRLYLLLTPILALIVPLLKLESIQKTVPKEYLISLPEVIINQQVVIGQTSNDTFKADYVLIIFWIGVIVFTILFLLKLAKIIRLIITNKVIKQDWYSLVILTDKESAFSFFNYIFINEKLLKNNDLQIIQHELIHCKQKHTIDLLLFEILKIVQWFNPIIYLFQQRITALHEYLSDDEIIKQTNAKTYFNKLLSETFNVENITFINQFYKQSLIKKRIAMITKNKSQKIKQLKYLLIAPLLFTMLIFSSFQDKSIETSINNDFQYLDTINPKNIILFDTIPFAIVDKVPIYPGCEGTESELKKCLQEKISIHVNKKFNSEITNNLNLEPGIKRVFVIFTINKEGQITNVRARAPHKKLQEEAIRAIKSLPKMIPGEFKGKVVNIKYSLPIAIMVSDKLKNKTQIQFGQNQNENSIIGELEGESISKIYVGNKPEGKIVQYEDLTKNEKVLFDQWRKKNKSDKYPMQIIIKPNGERVLYLEKGKKNNSKSSEFPFSEIDEVPVYPGCKGDQTVLRKCLQENITQFVSENFNADMAKNLKLSSGVKRVFVMFSIDKEGQIKNIHARAPHKKLQEEAIRVIKLIPKMIPGMQDGKNVSVKYSLPIAFKVD
ncbi:MAG: M56 family metallopeptidase [Lutibacter sp.]|uniref:M56 family metallopeptidase n=1 Tax=Lutibacter sp. TaxID=1925666 RepID=UPI00299EBC88|nr:M56 family metallopeptidase [Lutibacter sp.]MDX1830316.1 M56 family metallopeptidase [Lutibacter sp.]